MNVQLSTQNVQRSTNEAVVAEPVGRYQTSGMSSDAPKYDLEDRLLEFSVEIIRLAGRLPSTPAGRHVSGQLMRSGTASIAHHGEAQAAESRRDFVHKMRIGHKELRESIRWIKLIQRVPLVEDANEVESLHDENDQLIRIFYRSIQTA